MDVLVPFDAQSPKTRLAPLLDEAERVAFARAMLLDVLRAVAGAGHEPTVLATAPVDVEAHVEVDDRPLTPAVNAALDERDLPVAVVMADLPLATPAAIDRLAAHDSDVVLAPGLGGGTNAMVVRAPAFSVDFHGVSIRDHRDAARAVGASVAELDSYRLALDVDEPDDIAEVIIHSDGDAAAWLRDAGVRVAVSEGRVEPVRTDESGRERD